MKMKKNTVRPWWYFGVFAFIFASFLFCLYTSTAHAGIRFIRNWEGYVYELEDPSSRTVTILQYKGEKKEITIPKEIKGKKVIMASL